MWMMDEEGGWAKGTSMSFQWQNKTRGLMAKLSERGKRSGEKREGSVRDDILPTSQGKREQYSFVGARNHD